MPPAGGGNIKVVVRVRPFNSREKDRNAKCIVSMKDAQTVLTPPDGLVGKSKDLGQKVFAFDKSYWSFDKSSPNYAGQDNLHEDLGKPLLDNAFQGYNNCIFAYGQTGSGKSYSMMGYGPEAGVIPKICQDMFERIDRVQAADPNIKCTVEVSYLEIYNERVRDLLNPSTKGNLKVREHPSTGPYVEDLAKLVVSSFQEIENLMDEGNKARTVAATNMNETSSRSHAVFTLILTQKRNDTEMKMSTEKAAKISLVDLAGSERATSTGATGARLKEGAEINRSLSTLGRVISALADLSSGPKKKGKAATQVPYRDSVLTWLLKDSLGGNSMTAMIAAISPADINFDETLSTLRYADSAKRIKNHAVVNEDANARMIRELREELATLRSKLGGGKPGAAPAQGEIQYPEGTPLEQQIVSITQPDGTVKRVSKAEIAEQLGQAEKLYSDLNQTWEEKLQKTEEIHKEREAALEELGISIEKGFVGLHTPKKMPHLVNLSDDPLLAECLVYNLKPGTTTVGNVASTDAATAEIRLNGSRILHEHCAFENVDGIVTIVPREGAAVMINGKRVTEPSRLRSGYRIILGDFHIFRFNHPQEARQEREERTEKRTEKSLLRHSVTLSQLQNMENAPATPSPRPDHNRNYSIADSEFDPSSSSRADSPIPMRNRDSDWSFARREAASAILGTDQKIAGLTDEELNVLFEDVQRVRAERQNRDDDDAESSVSYPVREKYMSNGTIDNFSLDTAITMPSTPRMGGEVEDKLQVVRQEMQSQLEQQKAEFQEQLKAADAANVEVEEIKKEKAKMEESLREAKAEMVKQLEEQKKAFEQKIQLLKPEPAEPDSFDDLTEAEVEVAKKVAEQWRKQKYVHMAEEILQSAAILKEAQVLSQELDESVFFQFVILDAGHALCSSYDMVLIGIPGEGDDTALEEAPKPCVAVRVVDYKHTVVHHWSLQKLKDRVKLMRQLHQYVDRPQYMQHFKLDNPFVESCMPQYTLVGDVDIPLTAVFECRVQDFSLDVRSPYTSDAIGLVKLSLEPSSARAPEGTLKFNVVMHELLGFPEHEGTEVHAQLFIPGISEEGGVTTTAMIDGFDEGSVRFDSVHSMSLPLSAPDTVSLRISIFAKVSSMHLDKLLSWDDLRDHVSKEQQARTARIAETHFYAEEKHDVFARVQILELSESGDYLPVEVLQTSDKDRGAFQLHQGIQRRVVVTLTHSCGAALPWDDITNLRVGHLKMLDAKGMVADDDASGEVVLKMHMPPQMRNNSNGTTSVALVGQWDSSMHNSLLLDRVTSSKHKIGMRVLWDVVSSKVASSLTFGMDVQSVILSRSYVRQQSMFAALWQSVRVTHGVSSIFQIAIRPTPVKKVSELWRMNSANDYVKGEENLHGWTPRGVSLVRDFIAKRKQVVRCAEIEALKAVLGPSGLVVEPRKKAVKPKSKKDRQTNTSEATVTELKRPKTPEEQKKMEELESSDPPTAAANGTDPSKTASTEETAPILNGVASPQDQPDEESNAKSDSVAPSADNEEPKADAALVEQDSNKAAGDSGQVNTTETSSGLETNAEALKGENEADAGVDSVLDDSAKPDGFASAPASAPTSPSKQAAKSLEDELAEAGTDDDDSLSDDGETELAPVAVADAVTNVDAVIAQTSAEIEAVSNDPASPGKPAIKSLEDELAEAGTGDDESFIDDGETEPTPGTETGSAAKVDLQSAPAADPASPSKPAVKSLEDELAGVEFDESFVSEADVDEAQDIKPDNPEVGKKETDIYSKARGDGLIGQRLEVVEESAEEDDTDVAVASQKQSNNGPDDSAAATNAETIEPAPSDDGKEAAAKAEVVAASSEQPKATPLVDNGTANTAPADSDSDSDSDEEDGLSPRDVELAKKYLGFWRVTPSPINLLLEPANTQPPSDGAPDPAPDNAVRLLAKVLPIQKNSTVLKAGYLLVPAPGGEGVGRWVRRWVELRGEYLWIYSVPSAGSGVAGEEIGVVGLRNCRVDWRPGVVGTLRRERAPGSGNSSAQGSRNGSRSSTPAGRESKGTEGVWAVYASDNTWLFAARNEREKCEWIFAVDRAYFGEGEDA